MVEYRDWKPYYCQILRSFHYSREDDEESAHLLSDILPEPRLTYHDLELMIQGRTVFIFGAHERIENDLKHIVDKGLQGVFVAADGACSALRDTGLKPDLIVSDLDGDQEDLLFWNEQGVPFLIHAHGDNRERIRSIASRFLGSMAGTQSMPFNDVYNFGGFTDGDRCVFLADHFAAFRIILVGFNFNEVGKYSFTTNEDIKLRKLKWAKKLISLFEVEYFSEDTFYVESQFF